MSLLHVILDSHRQYSFVCFRWVCNMGWELLTHLTHQTSVFFSCLEHFANNRHVKQHSEDRGHLSCILYRLQLTNNNSVIMPMKRAGEMLLILDMHQHCFTFNNNWIASLRTHYRLVHSWYNGGIALSEFQIYNYYYKNVWVFFYILYSAYWKKAIF